MRGGAGGVAAIKGLNTGAVGGDRELRGVFGDRRGGDDFPVGAAGGGGGGSVWVWPKEISSIAAARAAVAVTGGVYQPVQVVAGGGRRGARIPDRVAAAATGRAGSRDQRRNGPAGTPCQSAAMTAVS